MAFRGQQIQVRLSWTNGDAWLIGSGLLATARDDFERNRRFGRRKAVALATRLPLNRC